MLRYLSFLDIVNACNVFTYKGHLRFSRKQVCLRLLFTILAWIYLKKRNDMQYAIHGMRRTLIIQL